jgi:beta-lactamase superfamily II metal-dependent hydrolase
VNNKSASNWTLGIIALLAAATLGGVGYGSSVDSTSSADSASPAACEPSYRPCIPEGDEDYDCEGGGGNGPKFIEGPVEVDHDVQPADPHELDPDGNGVGCEGSAPTPTIAVQEGFTIHFLDVGQGDATLIVTDGGDKLLVDGGRSGERLLSRLSDLDVGKIDAVLATHADADHIAGLISVLDKEEDFDVDIVYWNGANATTNTFNNFKNLWPEDGVTRVGRGDQITLGSLEIKVFHPDELSGDSNADSIVLLVECGTVEVLLTGDAEIPSEESMIDADILSEVDVLKVGHHGSRTATSGDFLEIANPEWAVISAGRDSQYGHPHEEVLEALGEAEVQVFLTDKTPDPDGVTMTTNCTDIEWDDE